GPSSLAVARRGELREPLHQPGTRRGRPANDENRVLACQRADDLWPPRGVARLGYRGCSGRKSVKNNEFPNAVDPRKPLGQQRFQSWAGLVGEHLRQEIPCPIVGWRADYAQITQIAR